MKKRFLENIKNHEMTVLKDDGLYRNLRFKADSSAYSFELICWPNHLCITGDMGTYTFSRIKDMFLFFRTNDLGINPHYWATKCISESIFGNGIKEFSKSLFEDNILSYYNMFFEDEKNEKIKLKAREDIKLQIIFDDEEHICLSSLSNFHSNYIDFSDFWEISDCNKYTAHFLWCLYGIVWGIQQYDTFKQKG